MRSKLAMFVAVCMAAAALGAAACRLIGLAPRGTPTVHATLTPELASYLGAFEPERPLATPRSQASPRWRGGSPTWSVTTAAGHSRSTWRSRR